MSQFVTDNISPELIQLSESFLKYEPPISEARALAMAAAQAEKERLERGEPRFTRKRLTISQDEPSGLLVVGEQDIRVYDDGRVEEGEIVVQTPLDPAERLEATRKRLIDLAIQKRDSELAMGAPTKYGKMAVDDKSRGLVNGAASMAETAIRRGERYVEGFTLLDRTKNTGPLVNEAIVDFGIEVGFFVSTKYRYWAKVEDSLIAGPTVDDLMAIGIQEDLVEVYDK